MGATPLVKEINTYLGDLSKEQQQAVLSVVKAFADKKQGIEAWDNTSFIAELDRRTAGYESGKVKVLTLDQLEARVKKTYKAKARTKR